MAGSARPRGGPLSARMRARPAVMPEATAKRPIPDSRAERGPHAGLTAAKPGGIAIAYRSWPLDPRSNISPRCHMNTARLLSILAASSLAGIAYAQTQTQTQTAPATSPSAQSNTPPSAAPAPGYSTTNPSSASSPHQRNVTGMHSHEAPTNANPGPSAAASPHQSQSLRMAEAGSGGQTWSNMPVESPSGQSLGSVSNVVPGLNGKKSSG